jgi:uncharacterized protein Yka (UPF0111/DUF47 family)
VKSSRFLPDSPDVLGMLCRQAEVTQEGMLALCAWAGGGPEAAQRAREHEHRADEAKKELRRLLTVAFTTPIDAEDIYVMSERLDAVLNGAKDTVREAEVMGIAPDEAVAAMAELLADGVERVYRKAASALLTVDDLREVIGRRELYRRFSRVGETLIEAADRVWYATVKEG